MGLPAWVEGRTPAPPDPLAAWIGVNGPGGSPTASELADAGMEALERVRRRPGRNRAAAFDLLGADALLTYACETALGEDDPEACLTRLVARVAAAP